MDLKNYKSLLVLVMLFIGLKSSAQTITTIADGGEIFNARGMFIDNDKNVYVACESKMGQFRTGSIVKIKPDGTQEVVAGGVTHQQENLNGPATNCALDRPVDVVLDGDGNMYFGCYGNGKVYKVDAVSKNITVFSNLGVSFMPGGMAIWGGNLYIISSNINSNLYKFALNNPGSGTIIKAGLGRGIAIDNQGTIYVSKYSGAGNFFKIPVSGPEQEISSGLTYIQDLKVTPSGDLYFTRQNNNIYKYISPGVNEAYLITGSAGYDLDNGPDNELYVSNYASRIYKVTFGPSAPSNFTANATDSKVELSWNAVSGATGYTIYRGASSANTSDVLATGYTGTSYTDNTVVNGTTYYYSITTTDALNRVSAKANAISATPLATPTITANSDLFANVGDAAITITTPTSTSAGTFTYTSSNTAVATISGNKINVGSAGEAIITATQAASGAYGAATTTFKITVTALPAPTFGTFANMDKMVSDGSFTITPPTSNSMGAFSYASSNTNVATISGNTVTIKGLGTTTITATQAANGGYASGTITATLTVGIKPPGNALTFDGSGDFVQIGNANTFDARNMKTIEAWVKFNDLVNEQEIISKSTSSNGLELIIYNRQLAVFAMGGGLDRHVDYPTSNLVTNRWYHVAATHNGANSTLTLYLNGVVVGTAQTPSGMTNSADPLHLGKWNDPYSNRYFKGSLDEVRIWNVQLTQAQIQAGMYQEIDPATVGLQAYYKFSEGIAEGNNTAITTTLDATANTRNGTLNGFTKTGSASNYTESYALVAPVLKDAADITGEGFTAKWETPITGVVDNYLLDVSESSNFSSFVTGYLNKDVGNVNEFTVTGLTANRTYYFRVRANKTSVNTQGTYSNVKTAATTKSNQTITFNDLAAKTYGEASFTLSATSTSNLTVTFESSDETIASVSGTTVTIKKAGTVNIIAKQAGNSLYNAAPNVTKQLVINKAPLTVTAQNATKTYDKVAYTGGNGISYAGFITGDNAANSVTGTIVYGGTSQNAINVASNYTIIPSGLTSANYAITYANGTLTINKATLTVTAQNATKTYDKVAYTGGNGISYAGFITGDNAANSVTGTVVYGGTSQNAINVANNYTIIPSGLSSANYAITYANGTLAINKAALTVTTKNDSKTYNKVAYTGGNGVDYTGFVTGDNAANSVTGTIIYGGTSQNAINVANNYTIIPSGLSSDNYAITYANGTLAINKATLTVTAQNATKTYDKVAYTGGNDVAYAGFIAGDNVINSTTGTINYSGTSQGAVAANTYTIIPSGLSSANYAITYINGALVINKATLTVTAQNATKTYDKVAYTGGNNITYSGFITGDNVANSVTGTVVYSGTSQGAVAANTYTIIPSGLSSANYALNYVNGTLTINKAALTVTAQNATKTYNGLPYTGGNGVTYAGFISGDNETNSVTGTINYGGTSQNAINANSYVITPSGLTSANYNLSYVNGTLVVNKVALVAIAENKARCFGITNPALTVRYTGFVNNETATALTTVPTVTTTATANSAAGNYTLAITGGTAANYTLTYQNGQLTVYALPVINIAAGKTTISRGDQIQLVATGGTSYSWANANGIIAGQNGSTLTIRPSLTTTYQVTVTNANGCTDTKSITIEVMEDFKITGTNLLTPNGDGYNDFFVLENIDLYPNNVVKIFDKAGRLVYSKVKYDNTWDGTFNGAPLAEGTYYYIVDFGKGNSVKKGFISIVRNGK